MAGSASAGIVVVLFIYSKRKKTNAYNDTNLWPAVHNSPRLFVYRESNVDGANTADFPLKKCV